MNVPAKQMFLSSLFASCALGAATSAPNQQVGQLPEITASVPGGGSNDGTGAYGNPQWSKHRRFAATRVYVQKDPWEIGIEQWWRVRTFDNKSTQHKFSEEIEIGLPFRAQLDFYYDWEYSDGESNFADFAAEVRWALADWDVIPLNPTLYAEYKWVDDADGPDVLELKLLLGDDIGEDWQYGVNFIWEQELAGEKTTEFQATGGISYRINDAISVGAEMKYVRETTAGTRSDPEHKLLLGHSIQIRPTENTHLDFVSLFGLTKDAPDIEGYVIVGFDFDFGAASGQKKVHQPVSGARN